MKKQTPRIKLTPEQKEKMVSTIQRYFLKERDEELGNLAALLMLDFITKELGPEFYNQGIYDSYQFMQDRTEDLLSVQI